MSRPSIARLPSITPPPQVRRSDTDGEFTLWVQAQAQITTPAALPTLQGFVIPVANIRHYTFPLKRPQLSIKFS